MSWEAFLALYIAGAVLCIFIVAVALKKETTQHGQEIILGMGCLLVFLWPLALPLILGAAVFSVHEWATEKFRK